MRISKKILAIALSILMAVSMMPFTVFAADDAAEINGTKYETFEAAWNAANDGDTIKLLKNSAGNGLVAPQGKFQPNGLTVDFDGFTYTVDGSLVGSTGTQTQAFQLLKDNNITFKNGTITSTKAKMLIQNYSNLTLDNMTLTLNNPNYAYAYTLSNNNGDVTIKDTEINANPAGGFAFDVCRYASYPSVNVTVTGDSEINGDVEVSASGNDAKDGFSLTLAGGELNGDIVLDATAEAAMEATPEKAEVTKAAAFEVEAPEGYEWDANGVLVEDNHTVAKIGNTKYDSLNAAITAASTGDTIVLVKDTTLTTTNVEINKNLTIDFGEYTVTAAKWPFINNATLTLNGTTGGIASARGVVDNYGTLIINGGVYGSTTVGTPTFWNNPDGVIVMNGGTINAVSAGIYNENATFTMNDGVINSVSSSLTQGNKYSYAVRNLPGSTTTMNGGTINAVHGGIAAFGDGGSDITTVVINGGTITTHNSDAGNDAFYAIYVSGNGTSVTVNDGTFSSPRAAAMLDDDDIGLTENAALVITGGTFTSPSGVATVTRGQNDSNPSISGGTFSSEVPAEFCAEGFAPVDNGDGTYGVTPAPEEPANGSSLALTDKIETTIYLDAEAYGVDVNDAVVKVTYNHNPANKAKDVRTDTIALKDLPQYSGEAAKYVGTYMFTYACAPAQLTEDCEIELYADSSASTPVYEETYSAKTYCDKVNKVYDEATNPDASLTKLNTLCDALVDYAKAAQIQFQYGSGLTEDYRNPAVKTLTSADITATANVKTADVRGFAFDCQDELNILVYTNSAVAPTGVSMNATKYADKINAAADFRDTTNFIRVKGLGSGNINKVITVNTENGDVTVSPNALVKAYLDSTSTSSNMKDLARAIYLYGAAAADYFGA